MSDVSNVYTSSSVPAIVWTAFYTDLYYQDILKMCGEGRSEDQIISEIIQRETMRFGYPVDNPYRLLDAKRHSEKYNPVVLFCRWVYHSYKYSSAVNALRDLPPQIKNENKG